MLNLQAMLNKVSKQQRIYEARVNFGCSTLQKKQNQTYFLRYFFAEVAHDLYKTVVKTYNK